MAQHQQTKRTEVIIGLEASAKVATEVFSNVKVSLSSVSEADAVALPITVDLYRELYDGLKARGVKVRALTEITLENVSYCKELLKRGYVTELRHLDGVKGNFAVSEGEYLAASSIRSQRPVPELIYSNDSEIVAQNKYVFDTLWSKGMTTENRIRELEEGRKHSETKVVQDPKEILSETRRMAESSSEYSVSSVSGGLLYAYNNAFHQFKEILDRSRRGEHGGIRWLTTIDESCLEVAKKFLDLGMQIRHVPSVLDESFGFSEKEVGVTVSRLEGGALNSSALFSNDPMYVEHYSSLFQELWRNAVPASERIKEIEQGIEEPRTRIIRDPVEVQSLYLRMVREAKSEILLILPSSNAYAREVKIGVIDAMHSAASERGVKVSMVAPVPADQERNRDDDFARELRSIDYRNIPEATRPGTVTVLVTDRTSSLIVELKDNSKVEFAEAIGIAMYSTRSSTVTANIRFFERMWEEQTLLDREKRSRRQAELLQDILAHDIRNYVQTSILNAELLRDEDHGLPERERRQLIDEILKADERTRRLIENTKRLGRIIMEEKPKLSAVSLRETLSRSVETVSKSRPDCRVDTSKISTDALILADEFLEEAFTNILSNGCDYSVDGAAPRIEVESSEEIAGDGAGKEGKRFWRISFTDYGRGIPEALKSKLFTRYLEGSSGTGLGLSIVYALVVERYGGRVKISDRVKGDHEKGTVVELWLEAA